MMAWAIREEKLHELPEDARNHIVGIRPGQRSAFAVIEPSGSVFDRRASRVEATIVAFDEEHRSHVENAAAQFVNRQLADIVNALMHRFDWSYAFATDFLQLQVEAWASPDARGQSTSALLNKLCGIVAHSREETPNDAELSQIEILSQELVRRSHTLRMPWWKRLFNRR